MPCPVEAAQLIAVEGPPSEAIDVDLDPSLQFGDMAVGEGVLRLTAANPTLTEATVVKVEIGGDQVVTTFPVGQMGSVGAADADGLWVTDGAAGTLTLDPESGSVVAGPLPVGTPQPGGGRVRPIPGGLLLPRHRPGGWGHRLGSEPE